jgi:hypothetical protein
MCILPRDGQDDKADHDLDVDEVASPVKSKIEESFPREEIIWCMRVL